MNQHFIRANEQIVLKASEKTIKESLYMAFLELDETNHDKKVLDEYNLKYPKTRDMNEEEFYSYQSSLNLLTDELESYENLENIPQIDIDYSEDENFMTEYEYINETKVIQEAKEAVKDEDGNIIEEAVKEETKHVRPFEPKESYEDEINEYLTSSSLYKERLKKQKLEDIEEIQIPHYNVPFDAHTRARGDLTGVVALANFEFNKAMYEWAKTIKEDNPQYQTAQMLITIYEGVYKQTLQWKGADNQVHERQVESIAEIGKKAFDEYANVIGAKK